MLLKNPENFTDKQHIKLEWIARTDPRLHRGYQLKEGLRLIFQWCSPPRDNPAWVLLAGWIAWARRCRIPEFVKQAATITKYSPLITNTLVHGMSNARSEATNTHLRTLTTRADGFHTPESLISTHGTLRIGENEIAAAFGRVTRAPTGGPTTTAVGNWGILYGGQYRFGPRAGRQLEPSRH